VSQRGDDYPPILFFYQGTVEEGAAFFGRVWREARAASDIENVFYYAFGLERGTVTQFASAEVVACGLRAIAKGNFQGRSTGDV
jgi:hypothetical protein